MTNQIILASLAMDLKRAALGLNRKSYPMAQRFLLEAIKRKKELNQQTLLPYIKEVLNQIEQLPNRDINHQSEDALMYSTLIQNYAVNNKT
ncbi:MAG: hypothetical protein UR52_C0022G0003 [Candidatus Gottesmanbacteria bacterium GW2011_GWA1_34_13]|uniref:Bacteriocin immunity protein n=1 Tax=Candidatus Gottesmanbacteria bacterium GW2011_GWA1_34_13 TaxID=1618434 RepID=A0A0G0B374_9BACT|nr:MAG: hypothetical protein UR52_C0022G0003 [Candidatus Gottesmanbacteria bacterium GW2011_GWA1_34_13]